MFFAGLTTVIFIIFIGWVLFKLFWPKVDRAYSLIQEEQELDVHSVKYEKDMRRKEALESHIDVAKKHVGLDADLENLREKLDKTEGADGV